MNKMIFLTGGARSGKSNYAKILAGQAGKNIVYIATCEPLDKEMLKRVQLHKRSRPKTWKTIEETKNLVPVIKKLSLKKIDAVIIDCLTLLTSNLMMEGNNERSIIAEIRKLAKQIKISNFTTIIVSNEVGSGIVPENKVARDFRDIAGRANQIMARESSEVYAMISGLPAKLK